MPVRIDIKTQDLGVRRMLRGLDKRTGDMSPVLAVIGEIGLTSIKRNFEVGGRPRKWKRLAPSTVKDRIRVGKWPGQILVRSGVAGGLLGSLHYKARPKGVDLVADKIYAAIHHFGGKTGRGHKTHIPARAFMLLQKEDVREIKETVSDYIAGRGAGALRGGVL
jgi:phage virion morphogenesis protein